MTINIDNAIFSLHVMNTMILSTIPYMQEFNMAGDLSDGSEIADFQEVSLTKDGLAS